MVNGNTCIGGLSIKDDLASIMSMRQLLQDSIFSSGITIFSRGLMYKKAKCKNLVVSQVKMAAKSSRLAIHI